MCLIIESGIEKPLVAEQDIICMKVVFKVFDSPERFTYRPVYYNPEFQYIIGEEAVEKIQTINIGADLGADLCADLGLHSFKYELNGWKRLAVWIEQADESEDKSYLFKSSTRVGKKVETVVLECIIPKGSEYYYGYGNCLAEYGSGDREEMGYTSNRLLPLREIPKSEWENYKDPILDSWNLTDE